LLLRGKIASLEEDLSKSRQETNDHKQQSSHLEKVATDFFAPAHSCLRIVL